MSSKPVRQDYIAKIRYTNNLPPPPLNPKFLEYNTTEHVSNQREAEHLMSSLFRKENFTSLMENLDEELGMNLNLINNRGFLDDGNETVIFNLTDKNNKDKPIQLHPKDRALLRDAGIGQISKGEAGVSFLRRTEYIAERQYLKSAENVETQEKAEKKDDDLDPDAQLRGVENTFELAQESLTNLDALKHPRKKNLKAVSAWPLLPDTSLLDTKYISVKFVGSASINRELQIQKRQEGSNFDEKFSKDTLESAILKPITSEDGEWISLYQVRDPNAASAINAKLHSTDREQPVNLLDEDEESEEYKFKHSKNYEMNFLRFSKPNEELSIKFIPEASNSKKRKVAYYSPITGRIDLKKYRASTNSEINRFVKDSTVDVINFKLREPTTTELKKMDTLRSEFDPMEYEGEEEEEGEGDADLGDDEFNQQAKDNEEE